MANPVPWKGETCSTAFAEKMRLVFDSPDIRDIVVSLCAPSPERRSNQIAVADRRFNTAWRRRTYELCKVLLRTGIRGLLDIGPYSLSPHGGLHASGILVLLDLEDVFNTEMATARATVRAAAGDAPESWRFSEEVCAHPQTLWSSEPWYDPSGCGECILNFPTGPDRVLVCSACDNPLMCSTCDLASVSESTDDETIRSPRTASSEDGR